jgi:hypothetical protein
MLHNQNDPVIGLVANAGRSSKIRVHGSIANQDVDCFPGTQGFVYQGLEFNLIGNIAGDHHGLTACRTNLLGNGFTRFWLAARYYDFGAMLGHA